MSQVQVQDVPANAGEHTTEKRRGRPPGQGRTPLMLRTYITQAQDQWLRTEATRRGVSVAAIVRACISGYMPADGGAQQVRAG